MQGSGSTPGSRRPFVIVSVVVAVLALLTAAGVSAWAVSHVGHPSRTNPPTYFAQSGVAADHAIRPATLMISVDGSLFVQHMRWSRWTSHGARGTGTAAVNQCTPNCALGRILHDPAQVSLSRPRQECGREFFTRVVLHFPKARPAVLAATEVFPFHAYCG